MGTTVTTVSQTIAMNRHTELNDNIFFAYQHTDALY